VDGLLDGKRRYPITEKLGGFQPPGRKQQKAKEAPRLLESGLTVRIKEALLTLSGPTTDCRLISRREGGEGAVNVTEKTTKLRSATRTPESAFR